MKRTFISALLLVVFAVLLYLLRTKYSTPSEVVVTPTNTGSVAQLLATGTTSGEDQTSTDVTLSSGSLQGYDYTGGGEYKPFFAQSAKQALGDGKNVILYFYASRDPTDQALDNDLQKRITRVPENTVIFRIDYDANENLRKSFNVTQQNTVIFLDKEGVERTRRAVGITTLSQIVKAMKE